ncbi:MAG TPA: YciI family protein [Cyclobacteriaceae bacterium]|jgi:uncharacterized protein YciI|nr:YciI family protein [Cyclobacteriaceae bacterium]
MRIVFCLLVAWGSVSAQPMVIVFLHHKSDKAELPKEQVDKIMEGHFANIKKLAGEGRLLVAGPFEGGGGIFIFNSKSMDEVKEWLKDDPGILNKRWNVEVLPYRSRIGVPQLVKEPYQMVKYNFIRFSSYVVKSNAFDVPQILRKHDDYLSELKKSGNIVAEGIFNDTDGGILIIKGDLDKRVVESDPAVVEGLLGIDVKSWYVAKGAFGEN